MVFRVKTWKLLNSRKKKKIRLFQFAKYAFRRLIFFDKQDPMSRGAVTIGVAWKHESYAQNHVTEKSRDYFPL